MSTSAEPGRTGPLVGRAAELDDLDDLLSTAAGGGEGGGDGGTVLIEGEAGIGKTSLVEALAASARLLDVEMRAARASTMRSASFAVLADALLADSRSGRSSGARGPVEGELTDLLEALHAEPASAWGSSSSSARRERAVELFAALLRRRGDSRPWVLVLEDVHLADDASLEVLLRLAHEGAVPRALVVLTMRPVPYRPALSPVIAAWTRAGARYVELRPLAPSAVLELGERLAGGALGPALRGTLSMTGGNPRLVADVVRTAQAAQALTTTNGVLDTSGTQWLDPLATLVRSRLDYLGPDVLGLLRQASVLGASFVVSDLATLVGEPVTECWRTLRHALAAGVVRARGDRLVFRHELVRSALYDGIDPALRRALHARAAWALREAGAPVDIVSRHLQRAR